MVETIAFFQKGLLAVIWLSMPSLIVAVITGVVVSLLQAVLSMQDQSIPFAVKLLAVGVTLAATGRWVALQILSLGEQALAALATFGGRP
ncbi:type III secretion system export apparatus subunit SctS [Roseateles depolymerans]|uniref:Type III secretion, HrpO family protein n=1 Tax=Roseateles depolymerans TaxID=76731 RepID=A0A0U3MI18_9BURK|nr:type III secretion system export apparatus subunit SctS [Roseateles depolymerans]ALV08301.1 Type III secretion, HrpO family protein [Roseateles depolymerans]REG21475.1 type III secretion protein S [Roseateles depolymerans]